MAKSKKIIVISTHDANIAIRTRPLNTILKTTSNNKYFTYVGNMFVNELKCIESDSKLSWSDESLKHLEGGTQAFLERGELYDE